MTIGRLRFRALAAAGCIAFAAFAADAGAQEAVRGRFRVELEPVASLKPGDPYPLDADTAGRYALAEAARVFSGMIYGWEFDYEIGDKSRKIDDDFSLKALGEIPFGDPRLRVTETETEGSFFFVWAEYRLDENQLRSFASVREGEAKASQGTGAAPVSEGREGRGNALDAAAREAVRTVLKGLERNRPKEARGTVVLVEAPRIWVDAGRFMCAGRFRVTVKEIVPYRFY